MKRVWRVGDDSSPSGDEVEVVGCERGRGRVAAAVVGCGCDCGVKAVEDKGFFPVMVDNDDGDEIDDGDLQSSAWWSL